jgi:hypothetical protein
MRRWGVLLGVLWSAATLAQRPDSLVRVQPLDASAQVLLDSLERARNRPTFTNVVITGYRYHDRVRQRYLNFGPLLDHFFQYNTVEGWVLSQHVDYNQTLGQGKRFLSLSGDVRYGFASRNFYAQGQATYWFRRVENQYLRVEGGRFVRQFNPDEPITFLQNTSATLFRGRNFLKLYQNEYLAARFRQPLGKYLALELAGEAATRTPLRNESDYSFRRREKRRFTSNNPLVPDGNSAAFRRHDAFLGEALLVWQPENRPTLTLGYRRTLGGDRVDAAFEKIWLNVRQTVYREPLGELRWEASAGTFLSRRRVYFPDYWHFSGNELLSVRNRLPQFFLLPYYTHSTDRHFAQLFAEHHFNGYFLNRSALFRALNWQEVLGLRTLYTPAKGLYVELNAGLENVFNVSRIDFITAFGDPYGSKFAVRYAIGIQ